ncbi:3-hydroxybutyryl-CoA dehydrogenase [Streptomyces europaeiscabiei]|uniref:3-hydroxybutyryl-CoA dehydrogenase n=1 Tax=Streptomyces europaeiscabiei TaxID=146819 RepID=A0ABU4NME6_9ACTN|nr:3-hydroxybutyryl-CoA dehydrogenase [Streptomyces europaeiscabiei]MDX2524240.1 3-hydroxybutyryl-CoA dehydrogenase [Streptomyces europaeiscabiei]MDX2771643.1 3-hydroxybutyryl-CoA dehydrogenase [Streptomyces europaeiscabiei]MDX3545503.1 3-hydroxybutyryl-CoA dehydrogenase [Streptomyces europaeiscabiei]MDX3555100.1 3-hydroxybutyryl-CoA dehydrogenase [Streptomyces europaeiscabiei]MDX3670708.1 3-hydroxybutyryl-CoA dehydrogenase [Streptomyces europaeiscabiei]
MDTVTRLGVVGCGLMGSGIAEVAAHSGIDVRVAEATHDAVEAGRRRITASLDRGVRRGKLSERQRDQALAGLSFTHDLSDMADRQFVIEAVAENRDIKTDVLRTLDKAVEDPTAILATNTSSIPVVDLAVATDRPAQLIGMHFFNPVPVQRLVELIPALTTSEETLRRTRDFARQLGRQVIQAPDRSGFVVNALLVPYLLSAVRMVESGAARPDDIDRGMELGCAHPMGPLRLLDLIGLDTAQAVAESMYEEFKEPLYAPPALLRRMVAAGHLGRKSGRGFHLYDA